MKDTTTTELEHRILMLESRMSEMCNTVQYMQEFLKVTLRYELDDIESNVNFVMFFVLCMFTDRYLTRVSE